MKDEATDRLQLVAFNIGAEEYAVPVHLVESIIPYSVPTAVPGSGKHILGVLNLRGKIISVVDLRCLFDLTSLDDPTTARVLVVQAAGATVGVLVDSVSEVFALDDETLHEPPPEVGRHNAANISGIIRIEDRLIVVLDLERLLTVDSGALAPA